jgi:hypothetical protein
MNPSDGKTVPVLIIIFNRPDKVKALIDALSLVKPSRIFIAADGPRAHVPSDVTACAEARRVVMEIPWKCEIRTLFSDTNLGVDPAVEKSINWFFDTVDRGIILEDDCIPHPDFFRFADEMLTYYQNEESIMMVSGNNFQNKKMHDASDYYFSRYPNTWGWATWKRAWLHFDTSLTALPQFVEHKKIEKICPLKKEQRYWLRYFKSLYTHKRTAWDAKWIFAMWNAGGISITPNVNLVQNIGFGPDSTHTFASDKRLSIQTEPMIKITHPPRPFKTNEVADHFLFETLYAVTIGKRFYHLYNVIKSKFLIYR